MLHVDLGLDRIFVWRFDAEKGTLTPPDPPSVSLPPGDGPRHFDFHPERPLALLDPGGGLDRSSCSTTTAATGRLAPRQTISTLPHGYAGSNFCSEILVSADGQFVYAGNRLHDSIGIFAVGADGELTHLGGRMDARQLPAQLLVRSDRTVPLLLQPARRPRRRLRGDSRDRRAQVHGTVRGGRESVAPGVRGSGIISGRAGALSAHRRIS